MRNASACLAAVGLLALIAGSQGCSSSSNHSGAGGGGGSAGSGGTGGSGGFSVAGLPGLALWLDASKGVTGTTSVTAWGDQSGKGNNASASGTGPALVASSIHGQPALTFTAEEMSIASSPTLELGTGEFTMEVVAKVTALGSELLTLSSGQSLASISIAATGGAPTAQITQRTANRNASGTINGADGQARFYAARRSGTGTNAVLEVRVDGAVQGTATGVGPIDLGTQSGGTVGGADTVADIAEVVVVAGPISDANLAALEAYLKTKYGL